jgi:hypothetical protein
VLGLYVRRCCGPGFQPFADSTGSITGALPQAWYGMGRWPSGLERFAVIPRSMAQGLKTQLIPAQAGGLGPPMQPNRKGPAARSIMPAGSGATQIGVEMQSPRSLETRAPTAGLPATTGAVDAVNGVVHLAKENDY